MRLSDYLYVLSLATLLFTCQKKEELPYLGEKLVNPETGEIEHYKAPDFLLMNQEGVEVSADELNGKVKVVDFFFTSCPTICPQMTLHLLEIQNHFQSTQEVAILSFSIDELNDTPERLNKYALNYEIDKNKWDLLTGPEETVLELAKDYKVMAFNDGSKDDVSLVHDGTFVLIDQENNIRGYYNGLQEKEIFRLIDDIEILLKD